MGESGILIAVTVDGGTTMYPAFQFEKDGHIRILPFVQIINRLLRADMYPASALSWWYDDLGGVQAERVGHPEDHKEFGNTYWTNVLLDDFSD